MDNKEKIEELKKIIDSNLKPLITDKFIYLGVSHTRNIGDILIWNGSANFLHSTGQQCLGEYSYSSFPLSTKLDESTIIILQGGGDFGDVWREVQNSRLKIIEKFKKNRIIIFPQTVHYDSIDMLKFDANEISNYSNITICVRDSKSYLIIKNHFKNNVLLVPDMAFYCDFDLNILQKSKEDRTLFLMRNDIENNNVSKSIIKKLNYDQIEIHDWPSLEKIPVSYLPIYFLNKLYKFSRLHFFSTILNNYFLNFYSKKAISIGVNFIQPYNLVYSSRLHVTILAILLNKQMFFLDNSYGKNSAFYDTWLQDLESIKFQN